MSKNNKKIIICGSMVFSKEMIEIKRELEKEGFEVTLPRHTKEYAELDDKEEVHSEAAENKIAEDLIKDYFQQIKEHDAILVVNEEKHGKENYIGGNAFLEMGFAHVLGKEIYVLNGMPDVSYKDEIEAMDPVFLEGNLSKMKNN